MKRLASFLLIGALAMPAAAVAQNVNGTATAPSAEVPARVDASKLGVSLDRIRRELNQAQASEQQGDALRLDFHVQVIGRAPRIDLLEGFDLDGPAVYGGPTHREVIDFLTPQAFKSPTVPISSVVYWAAQQLWQKSKKSRCEQEIAEYRALVMQGVPVAAPRCTQ